MELLELWTMLREAGPLVAALGALAAAFGALWAATAARNAAGEMSQKAQLELFLQFSEQYDRLRVGFSLPKNGGSGSMSEEEMDAVAIRTKRNEPQILQLFRLFEREHYLNSAGLVPPKVWKIWRGGMVKYASRKAVREIVLGHKELFRAAFIEEIVKEK